MTELLHIVVNHLIVKQLAYSIILMIFYFQDMEVSYFQAYIDGVHFVFMDGPIFRHMQNNIYGGNGVVGYLFLWFCYDWLIIWIIIIVMRRS